MVECKVCGKLRQIGRACACGAWVIAVALGGELHVEPTYDATPMVEIVAPSTNSHVATTGGAQYDAKTGRYVLSGYALSTGSSGGP